MSKTKKTTPANIIWFEIPADNPDRAKEFYSKLFGWKINLFTGMKDYWHIDTGGGDDTPDGGLMARKHPGQPITNYVNVDSVEKAAAKVEKRISSPVTCLCCQRTCAEASVAWPHKSTSTVGVNQRRSKWSGCLTRKAVSERFISLATA